MNMLPARNPFASFARPIALLAVLLGLSAPAIAHEFWLRPASFETEAGGLLVVRIYNGRRFVGDPLPRNEMMVQRFDLREPDGESHPVLGRHGMTVNAIRVLDAGPHQVVYLSGENPLELPADEFEEYLIEEKLLAVLDERAKRGESDAVGREVYVRCAKSLVTAAGPTAPESAPIDAPAGLPLEIVVQPSPSSDQNATQDRAASGFTARVLWRGEPIAGLRVVAAREASPAELHEMTSDGKGTVRMAALEPGVWMLTTLHMERLGDRDDADWRSFWSSTTFSVPAGPIEHAARDNRDAEGG